MGVFVGHWQFTFLAETDGQMRCACEMTRQRCHCLKKETNSKGPMLHIPMGTIIFVVISYSCILLSCYHKVFLSIMIAIENDSNIVAGMLPIIFSRLEDQ